MGKRSTFPPRGDPAGTLGIAVFTWALPGKIAWVRVIRKRRECG
ncbi:protein of unknown function [Candidatus Methylomirabilis oxygeniifera]|uniref:Uncharacterized protein n=1 Tax=Methylomirabilis oxygeniifera TaxID=671143 RepID=D5MGE6_METO1|nr:protein of unknown function [Candidatus Methylomirabilis oxyfera]